MFEPRGSEKYEEIMAVFGPSAMDTSLREVLRMCWALLPPDERNVDRVAQDVQRLLDRAIRDFRDDAARFGSGPKAGEGE